MSNNQKSRFMEVLDYFKEAELQEASALLYAANGVVADRKELAQNAPEPIRRRGRRPGSKNKPKDEEMQVAAD